jgi:hypothetical protein
MLEPKVTCRNCGVEFLVATASRTGGFCMRCARHEGTALKLYDKPGQSEEPSICCESGSCKSKVKREGAIQLAEAFIANQRKKLRCGAFQSVKHIPTHDEIGRNRGHYRGTFYVRFAYKGPKPRILSHPREDHPTVVLVDDETGECSIMAWM